MASQTLSMIVPRPPTSTLFPYTTLFRSIWSPANRAILLRVFTFIVPAVVMWAQMPIIATQQRSEEHTSELQSQFHLVCRPLLEKKKPRPQRCFTADAAGGRAGPRWRRAV